MIRRALPCPFSRLFSLELSLLAPSNRKQRPSPTQAAGRQRRRTRPRIERLVGNRQVACACLAGPLREPGPTTGRPSSLWYRTSPRGSCPPGRRTGVSHRTSRTASRVRILPVAPHRSSPASRLRPGRTKPLPCTRRRRRRLGQMEGQDSESAWGAAGRLGRPGRRSRRPVTTRHDPTTAATAPRRAVRTAGGGREGGHTRWVWVGGCGGVRGGTPRRAQATRAAWASGCGSEWAAPLSRCMTRPGPSPVTVY